MALTSAQLNNAMNHFYTGLGAVDKTIKQNQARSSAQAYNDFVTGLGLTQTQGPDALNNMYNLWTEGYKKGLRGEELQAFTLQGGMTVKPPVTSETKETQTTQEAPKTGVWGMDASKEQKESYVNKLLQNAFSNINVQRNAPNLAELPNFKNLTIPNFSL